MTTQPSTPTQPLPIPKSRAAWVLVSGWVVAILVFFAFVLLTVPDTAQPATYSTEENPLLGRVVALEYRAATLEALHDETVTPTFIPTNTPPATNTPTVTLSPSSTRTPSPSATRTTIPIVTVTPLPSPTQEVWTLTPTPSGSCYRMNSTSGGYVRQSPELGSPQVAFVFSGEVIRVTETRVNIYRWGYIPAKGGWVAGINSWLVPSPCSSASVRHVQPVTDATDCESHAAPCPVTGLIDDRVRYLPPVP